MIHINAVFKLLMTHNACLLLSSPVCTELSVCLPSLRLGRVVDYQTFHHVSIYATSVFADAITDVMSLFLDHLSLFVGRNVLKGTASQFVKTQRHVFVQT